MIFGSFFYNAQNICLALDQLGISYILIDDEHPRKGKFFRHARPSRVYVVDGLKRFKHIPAQSAAFVCDAKTALSYTNADKKLFQIFDSEEDFLHAVGECAIDERPCQLQVHEPSLANIVSHVTTKSMLTDVQTSVNRITPYALRKKVHGYVISFLFGKVSVPAMERFLDSSPKMLSIKNAMHEAETKRLREAVAMYRQTHDEYAAAEQFNVHTFEILYVYNSYSKLGEFAVEAS